MTATRNAADTTTGLSFRLFQDEDLAGLLRRWETESEWGPLSTEQWRSWYVDTPHGPCIVAVAVEKGDEVHGQLVLTPARLRIRGREVAGLRVSAPVLSHAIRRRSLRDPSHPVVGLFNAACAAARDRGYSVLYAMPEHAWLPLFRWMPQVGLPRFESADYPCYERSSHPTAEELRRWNHLATTLIRDFGAAHERLWEIACERFPIHCGVVRSRHWLRWRNGANLVVEVRQRSDGALLGFASIKRDGLLFDALARAPEDLEAVVGCALRSVDEFRGEGPRSIRAMGTPMLEPALQALGFVPSDYRFAFVCLALDPGLVESGLQTDRWYVMPGD